MTAPRKQYLDTNVNHEVIFECGQHNVRLDGTPIWTNRLYEQRAIMGDDKWTIDTSEMWCSHPSQDDIDPPECLDTWRVSIDGTWA